MPDRLWRVLGYSLESVFNVITHTSPKHVSMRRGPVANLNGAASVDAEGDIAVRFRPRASRQQRTYITNQPSEKRTCIIDDTVFYVAALDTHH